MRDAYTHGHHDSVLRSHRWRTAENSAGYLLPHLRDKMTLLDVGCGPGTITADLATHLSKGSVIGIDAATEIIEQANRQYADKNNLSFQPGDVYHLRFDDDTFDVVHAHQVLQHLSDPVAALVEMRRVLRPSGILAVRECDYAGFTWAPKDARLDRWMTLYHRVTLANNAEADAGRYLLGWVQRAGLSGIEVSGSLWTYADDESRAWWGGLWAERVCQSSFAEQAIAYQLATIEELGEIADAWNSWMAQQDGFFSIPSVEVLASK